MTQRSTFQAAVVVGALLVSALAAPRVLADDLTRLAKELAELRGEVESLSAELSNDKAGAQDELRALARQKQELALELDRERIRLQKLRMSVAKKRERVEAEKEGARDLIPIFENTAQALKRYIEAELPFRVQERLSEVDKLQSQLDRGVMTPQRAVSRLWTMIEDEHRMTREHGLFRQTIVLDNREQLVEIARLGMTMLFFKTNDGRVGHAQRGNAGWTYRTLTAPDQVECVNELFESFKKQIRVGYFELPNALGSMP